MAKCGYCGSNILIGGVRAGDQRFCNNTCHRDAFILSVTKNVPAAVLERQIEEVWRGHCLKCQQPGPIDVHKFHEVWSALILTRWTTQAQVSCHACGVKRQLGGAAFSLCFGWWGFPWGLILTPVQITRNVVGMCRGPKSDRPSDELRKQVLVNLGAQMIARQASAKQPPPLPNRPS